MSVCVTPLVCFLFELFIAILITPEVNLSIDMYSHVQENDISRVLRIVGQELSE